MHPESSGPPVVRDREIMLALAGSIGLPQPYPEVGSLSLVKNDQGVVTHVVVTSIRPPYRVVRYIVARADVRAVYLAETPPTRLVESPFKIGEQIDPAIGDGTTGIAFVQENASVLVRHEMAVTAQEIPEHYDLWFRGPCDR
jgi:hypothetical protein